MLIASYTHFWVEPTPRWLAFVLCLPTLIALIALAIVLVRERRRRR